MWQGRVDGGRLVNVLHWNLGRWMVVLNRQYTGDCYGVIGGDSWMWQLVVARAPK
jgi:hypothetical protein